MDPYFQFEADFTHSLRCIPMTVRYKLDLCGLKLKLHHWHHLTAQDRQILVATPCFSPTEITAYSTLLQNLVQSTSGESLQALALDPDPAWAQTEVPTPVQTRAQDYGLTLSSAQWQGLAVLQRFALVKLSRDRHGHRNFLPALQEFKLIEQNSGSIESSPPPEALL